MLYHSTDVISQQCRCVQAIHVSILHTRIVQGADWHFGADNHNKQPAYIQNAALATFIICIIFFLLYLALQVRIKECNDQNVN